MGLWIIHGLVTVGFIFGLKWACKKKVDYDSSWMFKLPLVVLLYVIYWAIVR
jgi:hypothetical protein